MVPNVTRTQEYTGLEEEGLFRRSPNSVLLKQVQQAYDRGIDIFSTLGYMCNT